MKRTSLRLAALGLVAAGFCFANAARAADPVKIGILWPLTGNAAAAGQASSLALTLVPDGAHSRELTLVAPPHCAARSATLHRQSTSLPLSELGTGYPNIGHLSRGFRPLLSLTL